MLTESELSTLLDMAELICDGRDQVDAMLFSDLEPEDKEQFWNALTFKQRRILTLLARGVEVVG